MTKATLEFDLDILKDSISFHHAIKAEDYRDRLNEMLALASAFSQKLYIEMLVCLNDADMVACVNAEHYDDWLDYVKGVIPDAS